MQVERFLTQAAAIQHRNEMYLEKAIMKSDHDDSVLQENFDDHLLIFAVEYPGSHSYSKGRYFIVVTLDQFWRLIQDTPKEKRHFYELIEEKTPCFPYFDLECQIDDAPAIEIIVEAFADAINASGILPIDPSGTRVLLHVFDIVVMRSLPMVENKFSLHLVVRPPGNMRRDTCLMFPDNALLGKWVSEIILPYLQASFPSCVSLIDMSVYTKNRTIRTAGSTKKSKESYFLPYTYMKEAQGKRCTMILESDLSKATFSRTLITTFDCHCRLLSHASMCSFLGLPLSNSGQDIPTPQFGRQRLDGAGRYASSKSFHPVIDAYIREEIDDYRNVYWYSNEEAVCYSLKNLKYCGNIGRDHKSNGVYVVVNTRDLTIHQRCFDVECRGFRGPKKPLPISVQKLYEKSTVRQSLDQQTELSSTRKV